MREKILLVRVPQGGLWSPVALKYLSWSLEPKASLNLEPEQKCCLAKWSPGVKQWSPRALNFPSWSPGALHFLGRSPGALNPFGTLSSIVTPAKSWVKALWHFSTLPLTYRSYLKECHPCSSAASSQRQCGTIDFHLFLDIVNAEMLNMACYCCHCYLLESGRAMLLMSFVNIVLCTCSQIGSFK